MNGDFLCRSLTGIERFACELCIRLGALVEKDTVVLCVPANAPSSLPDFGAISVYRAPQSCRIFPVWEHGAFSACVRKLHGIPLDFSNATPLFNPGIVFIHDIYAKVYPHDFTGKKEKLIRWYMCMMYRYAVTHAQCLITVSEFSRHQIAQTYGKNETEITVIPNGWDHFKTITADDSIFTQFPVLKTKPFFFTLGSLQKRKNLQWIVHMAILHPDQLFVVSGKSVSGFVSDQLAQLSSLKNIIQAGYVSDRQIKALMQHCRAFIFPSYYEGFGIPPLEALSCGAAVIAARAASLPEIYGSSVHWIDPDRTDYDLDELLQEQISAPDAVLNKYTYDHAAQLLNGLIRTYTL